jgi:hypothetical protein
MSEALTLAYTSNWDDTEFDTSANTAKALPDAIHDQHEKFLDSITEQWELTIVRTTTGDEISHHRHESVGKHSVCSFKTHVS